MAMVRDAEASKRRIFEAAIAEFAEHGLAGARVDAIAERAKANKQLIYAYFGSKEELFAEVLGRELEELAEEIVIDPERLAEYAGKVFDFHAEHPELARLLLSEALSYGQGPVPRDEQRLAHNVAKVRAVRAKQKRGGIDPALDARDVVMLVIALAIMPTAMPQVVRMVEGADPNTPRARARRRASVIEAVRRVVEPR